MTTEQTAEEVKRLRKAGKSDIEIAINLITTAMAAEEVKRLRKIGKTAVDIKFGFILFIAVTAVIAYAGIPLPIALVVASCIIFLGLLATKKT